MTKFNKQMVEDMSQFTGEIICQAIAVPPMDKLDELLEAVEKLKGILYRSLYPPRLSFDDIRTGFEEEEMNITVEEVQDLCKVLGAVRELLQESDEKVRSLMVPLVEVFDKPCLAIPTGPQTPFEKIRGQLTFIEREAISLYMNLEKFDAVEEMPVEEAPAEDMWEELALLNRQVEDLSALMRRQGEFICRHNPFAQEWLY